MSQNEVEWERDENIEMIMRAVLSEFYVHIATNNVAWAMMLNCVR